MNSSTLETEAMKRKERLLMMKRKLAGNEGSSDPTEDSSENQIKKPTFRSYNPADEKLKTKAVVIPPAEPADVEIQVKDQIESAKEITIAGEIDLSTLAPRKIDWDLKRDVDKKLRKLERRTQQAIAELIRDRLSSGQHDDLLLSAVNSGARAAQDRHSSDEDD